MTNRLHFRSELTSNSTEMKLFQQLREDKMSPRRAHADAGVEGDAEMEQAAVGVLWQCQTGGCEYRRGVKHGVRAAATSLHSSSSVSTSPSVPSEQSFST